MNKASPVDLRKSLEIANHLAHIGIRFVPIPVETEEEFQTLAAELSRRLEQRRSKPRRMKAVLHEGTNHQVAKAAFFIAGVHIQPY
ncbi:hypothetical protein SR80_17035 [Enterobacter hormaechei subsp. xiangfangensis]|nr:hypothetical protein LI63_007860 [Enterobacter hormaechei subsp. xiangfangensis]EUM82267.1 hypothetical protein L353_06008 [Enterobacter sp. MGH 7]KHQ59210.1 hypothetical protein KV13_19855 [Enterobacter hormaechei subsp. oharae]KJF33424.1 hypothetical protein L469_00744 [Enterobacter hormaechei]KHC21207.1 hypothetical protein KV26_19645 [Enterobacter hormaechei subsp. xiangfangensis]